MVEAGDYAFRATGLIEVTLAANSKFGEEHSLQLSLKMLQLVKMLHLVLVLSKNVLI